MKKVLSIFIFLVCFVTIQASAQSWPSFVRGLRQQAIQEGISPKLFDSIFKNMQPGAQQVKLDKSQPERRITFLKYRQTRIDNYRILIGRRKFNEYKPLLLNIARQSGVDPCFVTAIWGVESSYGYFLGSFPVINSLATLSYHSNRKAFFRKELFVALRIVQEGHVPIDKFKGEWAGASGHSQFLPSSWYKYAVDYNGDGHKDIWTTKADALASIANYLKMNGWQTNQPWGVEVKLTQDVPGYLVGLGIQRPVSFWLKHGVTVTKGRLPATNTPASLIEPDGGPYFLVFNNFRVIMTYNNSTYYAGSVAYLADEICYRDE